MDIKLISFNIEGFHDRDIQNLKHTEKRYEIIKEEVIKKDFDICFLQEVFTFDTNTFLNKGYNVYNENHCSIIIKNKYEIKHKGILPNTCGIYLDVMFNNLLVRIITGWWDPSSFGKNERINCQNILKELNVDFFIFAGDTNLRQKEIIKNNNKYNDCLDVADEKDEGKNIYTVNKLENKFFFDDDIPYTSRYDRCFITKNIKCKKLKTIFKDKYENLINESRPSGKLSDHYGLMIELELPKNNTNDDEVFNLPLDEN
jgi:hypothetical protein